MTVQKSLPFAIILARPGALHLTVLLAALELGCGERHDARAEAEALMTSLSAVSDEGSFVERSAALERLNQLQLHFPTHSQAREVCSAAHKGLLEAEIAQAEAQRALGSAADVDPGGGAKPGLEQTQAESIASDIERSNRALASAKDRFPKCEDAMRNLLRESR